MLYTGYTEKAQEDISSFKKRFCSKYDLNWCFDCWFCQYIKDCNKCPIRGKGLFFTSGCNIQDAPYHTVIDCRAKKEERVDAARKIIKALGG